MNVNFIRAINLPDAAAAVVAEGEVVVGGTALSVEVVVGSEVTALDGGGVVGGGALAADWSSFTRSVDTKTESLLE